MIILLLVFRWSKYNLFGGVGLWLCFTPLGVYCLWFILGGLLHSLLFNKHEAGKTGITMYLSRWYNISHLLLAMTLENAFNYLLFLGSIPASFDIVESEGRQMKQCWIQYIEKNSLLIIYCFRAQGLKSHEQFCFMPKGPDITWDTHFTFLPLNHWQVEDELLSLQAELESGLTELGQTEAKRLEALQVRLTISLIFILFIIQKVLFSDIDSCISSHMSHKTISSFIKGIIDPTYMHSTSLTETRIDWKIQVFFKFFFTNDNSNWVGLKINLPYVNLVLPP